MNGVFMDVDPERALSDALQAVSASSQKVAEVASNVTSKNILKHPDAHPIVLDLLFLQKYGPEWLGWEGETLQHLAPQDFGHPLSDLNLSKAQACKTLHMVDTYWQRWEVFLWCTMPFNSFFPDFNVMQVPTVAQCLVSIDVANRIRNDVDWSSEVLGFLEAVYQHDGIYKVIAPTPALDILHIGGADNAAEQQHRRQIAEKYLEDSRARLSAQLKAVGHG